MDQEKWWLEYDPPKANYKSGFGRGPFGVALRSVQRLSLTCEIILASLRLFGVHLHLMGVRGARSSTSTCATQSQALLSTSVDWSPQEEAVPKT